MRPTLYLKSIGLILLVVVGYSLSASAQITARDRFKLLQHLIPEDPENLLLNALPKVNRYSLSEANSIYKSKKDNPLIVNQSWQDLAINYLLHGQYERTLECLEEAQEDFTEDLTDLKIIQAYAYTKLHNWSESNKRWKAIAVLMDPSYIPALHLFSNAIKQYKLEESTEILEKLISEQEELTPLLHHYMGVRHFQEGDLHQARVSFIKAITTTDLNPYALLGMSLLSLTEAESFDALGWLQQSVKHASIPLQRSMIEIPSYAKLQAHPDFRRTAEMINNSSYEAPEPALEENLSYRYNEEFGLTILRDGGLRLRLFEPKVDLWKMN